MRPRLAPVLLVLAAVLATAASADARTREVTLTAGPYEVGPYQVALQSGQPSAPPSPGVDGYITKMSADVVDARTRKAVPIQRIMLHHIVFANLGPEGGPRKVEPFYGDGEERATMDLPEGYGYPIAKGDRWRWVWMLMNHRAVPDRVLIRYRMTVVTGKRLKPVRPVVFDTSRGRQALVFDVPGTGGPGSFDTRTHTKPAPVAGRIVAGLGHVHGGARGLRLSQPDCGDRTIYHSRPTWGRPDHPFYRVRPVLHEPGPIDMSQIRTREGIPVAAGERLRLTSRYENWRPHTRAMGLMLVYLHPDSSVTERCGALPDDTEVVRKAVRGRATPPPARIRIYDWSSDGRAVAVPGPSGPMQVLPGDADVQAVGTRFAAGNLSVPVGARVRWTFGDPILHNVTVADGPEGFSSNRLKDGATYEKTFTRPGTYTFFCELHPVGMVQRVVVRRAVR